MWQCCMIIFFFDFGTAISIDLEESKVAYTNQWAVSSGGTYDVRHVISSHGFIYSYKIFDDYHAISHTDVKGSSSTPDKVYHNKLTNDPRLSFVKQLTLQSRNKRDIPKSLSERRKRSIAKISDNCNWNDTYWESMWYMNSTYLNITGAWNQGVSGKGVVITTTNDGLERNHSDLQRNYDADASWDYNSQDNDPMPRYTYDNENRQGTENAGVIAALGNNSKCGVGIAYNAKIGGIRMLDGNLNDAIEAASLSFNRDHIDIYLSTWGPTDNGRLLSGPGTLTQEAIYKGVRMGRSGLGSIYVWAGGNGGRYLDTCACDGYVNSIFTIAINSVDQSGKKMWYSEECPGIFASAYEAKYTTSLHDSCTSKFNGTASSSAAAAAVIALTLEANPMLSWRDIQHIIVQTANTEQLISGDFVLNAAGRKVSSVFGFGVLDAGKMVSLAKQWIPPTEQLNCTVQVHQSHRNQTSLSLKIPSCDKVVVLEHVVITVTMKTEQRGNVEIVLESKQGTRSKILPSRPKDYSSSGFSQWSFMSVQFWGETSSLWTLYMNTTDASYPVDVEKLSLTLYGTSINTSYHTLDSTAASQDKTKNRTDECDIWKTAINNITQSRKDMSCERNTDCKGFHCSGVVNTQAGPNGLIPATSTTLCYGLVLLNCDKPPAVLLYAQVPDLGDAAFQEKLNHSGRYKIEGATRDMGSGITAQLYLNVVLNWPVIDGQKYLQLQVKTEVSVHAFFIDTTPDELKQTIIPDMLIPVPACENKDVQADSIMSPQCWVVVDKPPIAIAGPDIIVSLPTDTVTLYGNKSMDDLIITEYQWTYISGPSVDMGGARTAFLHLSHLQAGDYIFKLKVTDVKLQTDTDLVHVHVSPALNSTTPATTKGAIHHHTRTTSTAVSNVTTSLQPPTHHQKTTKPTPETTTLKSTPSNYRPGDCWPYDVMCDGENEECVPFTDENRTSDAFCRCERGYMYNEFRKCVRTPGYGTLGMTCNSSTSCEHGQMCTYISYYHNFVCVCQEQFVPLDHTCVKASTTTPAPPQYVLCQKDVEDSCPKLQMCVKKDNIKQHVCVCVPGYKFFSGPSSGCTREAAGLGNNTINYNDTQHTVSNKSANKGLTVGLPVACVLLIVIAVAGAALWINRRKFKSHHVEEESVNLSINAEDDNMIIA